MGDSVPSAGDLLAGCRPASGLPLIQGSREGILSPSHRCGLPTPRCLVRHCCGPGCCESIRAQGYGRCCW